MKQILFFGVRDDLLTLLQLVDPNTSLKYLRMGNFRRDEAATMASVFNSPSEISGLGRATADSSVTCDAFLVCDRETPVHVRVLAGGNRVCIDQLINPDSVEFSPGGIWDDGTLLHGRIATASDSRVSEALMKRFVRTVQNNFSKVHAFYVGPLAMARFEEGMRLTASARSPREFDLAR